MCLYSVAHCTPLLIQQNDGSGGFNRPWAEYKEGFGDPSGNYWLGNDLLNELTDMNRYKLKFDLHSRYSGKWYSAKYSTFIVLSEEFGYRLQAAGFSGNASNDAFGDHNNRDNFSTFDRDNDGRSKINCAATIGGGFWYRFCGQCRVNGARSTGNFYWRGLPGGWDLQYSRMWLQCR